MPTSTPEDKAFKRRVAEEFNRARDRALAKGLTIEDFVRSLGITRAGFHKQITGKTMPSLRVLRNARKYWGVRLSYGELGDRYVSAKKADPRQMGFAFMIEGISKDQFDVKRVSRKGPNAIELVIQIDFSKTA